MARPPATRRNAPAPAAGPGVRRPRSAAPVWALTGAAVLVQIGYPLVPDPARPSVTVASVLVFCAAAVGDVARLHGPRGAAMLLAVAGGGGLAVEAVGVRTGVPFGTYSYTGDLGPQVLGVPVVVPLAWAMMAWPALVVGRTLAPRAHVPVAVVGGAALAAWDLFLDPQMVDAGHWRWAHPQPAAPLVPGVPLTNYAGWLVVAVVLVGVLDRLVAHRDTHRDTHRDAPSGPAAALYLWVYGSSVVAHLVFFDRPGSALVGGVVMGAVALPFAVALPLARAPWVRGVPDAPVVDRQSA